jgi:Methyltransferase domain
VSSGTFQTVSQGVFSETPDSPGPNGLASPVRTPPLALSHPSRQEGSSAVVVRKELSFSSNVPTAYSRVTIHGKIRGKGAAGMSDTLTKETERIRRIWEKQAPRYDRSVALWEKILFGDGRWWVCSQIHGEVLEVAIGTGLNLAFYPDGVRLTGVDLSPAMLGIARQRARELGMEVDLREGDAQGLSFPDESFDTVVCTLSLCGIPDDRKAVAEMKRVLRPGGRLLLLDHVRAASRVGRAVQRER